MDGLEKGPLVLDSSYALLLKKRFKISKSGIYGEYGAKWGKYEDIWGYFGIYEGIWGYMEINGDISGIYEDI